MKLKPNIYLIRMILVMSVLSSGPAALGFQFRFGERTPFCKLFSPTESNGRKVTRATLYEPSRSRTIVDGGDRFLFSLSCNNRDYFAIVRFTETAAAIFERSLQKYHRANGESTLFDVEAEVNTIISPFPIYGNLSRFRAEFEVTAIKVIKQIHDDKSLPDFSSAAPVIDNAISLEASNAEFLHWLLSRERSETKFTGVGLRHAKFSIGSQAVNLGQISTELSNYGNDTSVQIQSVEVTNSQEWVLRGLLVRKARSKSYSWRFLSVYHSSSNPSHWELKKMQLDRVEGFFNRR